MYISEYRCKFGVYGCVASIAKGEGAHFLFLSFMNKFIDALNNVAGF